VCFLQQRAPCPIGRFASKWRDIFFCVFHYYREIEMPLTRGKNLFPATTGQAILLLFAAQLLISLYWLSQGGFFIVKDTSYYLALASRAAELPFLADCHDKFRPSAHVSYGPYYLYLLNMLQRLPGGFAPYNFALAQLFHFGFVVSFFFLARLWRSIPTSFLISLLCLLEPLHHWDVLIVKSSFCTQATIGMSLCLAAYGWKKKKLSWFAFSAFILAIGNVFRAFNASFMPTLLLLAFLGGKNWKTRATNIILIMAIWVLINMPLTVFFSRNPQIKPLGAKVTFGILISNRCEQYGRLKPRILPKTLEYYYSLAPRLEDTALVQKYRGTSMPFFHAFLHERIYRYGDTLNVALTNYGMGGITAFREDPAEYLKSCVRVFIRNWGLPSRYPAQPRAFSFALPLWKPVGNGQPAFRLPAWGNTLLRIDACSAPFEQCLSLPAPDLISEEMRASLQGMPSPGYISYLIGKTWDWMSPVKGMFAFALLLASVARLTLRKEWDILVVGGSVIGTYLGITTFLALATTGKIVMMLPWIVWTAGMAFSKTVDGPDKNGLA
jgi:hypothetical protein